MKKTLIIITIILFLELLLLGYYFYSKNSIDKVLNDTGFTKEEKDYIKETFDDIIDKNNSELYSSFKESDVFDYKNLERYIAYYNKTDYDPKDVVMYVEIGLDKEFYTNIKQIENTDNPLVLVNKYYKLPSNYQAKELVTLNSKYSKKNSQMKKIAAEAIMTMMDDAKKEDLSLNIISGYRTESYQNMLFTNSTKKNGLAHALIYSAKPGHSEHQTGLAADFNLAEEEFEKTNEYKWLKENAHNYGFIERYPKGKEFITGYGYEPWHYRYIGKEAANIIYNEKLTFEEYQIKYIKTKN